MKVPGGADRDFTASAFIVNENSEVLLIKHSKLGEWIQPGGHIEDGETPDEAARREAREEVGVKIEFLNKSEIESEESDNLPSPFNVNLHSISEDHMHCDFNYLANPVGEVEATHSHEHDSQKWFSRENLEEVEKFRRMLEMPAYWRLKNAILSRVFLKFNRGDTLYGKDSERAAKVLPDLR